MDNTTNMPMYNTTYHEPKNYMFVFGSGDPMREINDVLSFKDAVLKIDPYHLPRESLDKLDDTDIDEIIELFNIYSDYTIDKVYLIDKKIYDYYEEE